MKRKKFRRAAQFEFPPSVMTKSVNLIVYADAGCTVDHYGEILTYTPELLRLDTELGVLRIAGESLLIQEMDDDTLMLTGRLGVISYENYERS